MVLFTNFSACETSNDSGGEISYDEEEKVDNPQETPKSSEDSISLSMLIDKFREDLVSKLMEDQCMSSKLSA